MAGKQISEPPSERRFDRVQPERFRPLFDKAVQGAGFTGAFTGLVEGSGSVADVISEIRKINGAEQKEYLGGSLAIRKAFRDNLPGECNEGMRQLILEMAAIAHELKEPLVSEISLALINAAGKDAYLDCVEEAVESVKHDATAEKLGPALGRVEERRTELADAKVDYPLREDAPLAETAVRRDSAEEEVTLNSRKRGWVRPLALAAGVLAVVAGLVYYFTRDDNVKPKEPQPQKPEVTETAQPEEKKPEGPEIQIVPIENPTPEQIKAAEPAAETTVEAEEDEVAASRPARKKRNGPRPRRAPKPEVPTYERIVGMLEDPIGSGTDVGEERAGEVAAAIGSCKPDEAARVFATIEEAWAKSREGESSTPHAAFMVSVLRHVALGDDSEKAVSAIAQLGRMAGNGDDEVVQVLGSLNEADEISSSDERAAALRSALSATVIITEE
jgi:hypothetical protein